MKKEIELKFPVFESEPLPPPTRTLDEINEWIEQDYLLFFDRASYAEEKKRLSVNVPFVL